MMKLPPPLDVAYAAAGLLKGSPAAPLFEEIPSETSGIRVGP